MIEKHKRTGIVTNVPPGEPIGSRAHMSTTTCERPECLERHIREVAAFTNETAVYYADRLRGVR